MDLTNNRVSIVGEIVGYFEYSHELYGEKFYTNQVKVDRLSSVSDLIPIMVSDRAVDVKADWIGKTVEVFGQFRSHNKKDGERTRLILSVFADEFNRSDIEYNFNYIEFVGYVCKETIYRKTPAGREITDVFIAVNRPYGKTDYFPCIAWGRNAFYTSKLPAGTKVKCEGRIQSREYTKCLENGNTEVRTAYEVSISKIEEVRGGNE
jgi:single-stranded DNA-binding protein